ncbi:hypothetical protein POVWA2_009510 [Plasmodium ovale wallikeri]|uniref:Uncharacterized protein n=1 Tax=Plasmodium ovale wallikeri TaxID=864142 RepID=A0A1A8YK66_PLAOA|nr:hypothetical protein POVWA1_009500 [Plasmodium ovale wallikeri]SBT32431.1 hypothetical protein POVWA2_009510 [Plasmodium ovale wallikeri]
MYLHSWDERMCKLREAEKGSYRKRWYDGKKINGANLTTSEEEFCTDVAKESIRGASSSRVEQSAQIYFLSVFFELEGNW